MSKSSIEWTNITWNPTTGCTEKSAGCKFCYAKILHNRLRAMGQEKYSEPFHVVRCHESELKRPYTWRKPQRVFVNSMSDIFHEDIPLSFIKNVFKTMNDNPQHQFQVLTKRSERLLEVHKELGWTDNIWMGVSVENETVKDRISHLRKTGAKVKFISCEPLIGPLTNMNLKKIHWVITGGESGWKARPIQKSWVKDILLQCRKYGVAFFHKQWGGKNKKASGRLLNGREYNEYPASL